MMISALRYKHMGIMVDKSKRSQGTGPIIGAEVLVVGIKRWQGLRLPVVMLQAAIQNGQLDSW